MRDFANTKPMGMYEVAIGEKNQDYYLDKFEDFDQKGTGWHASWNWAAFFFTGLWALYRKMYGWFVIWLIILTFFKVFPIGTPSTLTALAMLLVNIALWLGFTVFANSLYHRKVKARLATAKNSNSNALRASRKLSAGGGVHTWVPIVFAGIPAIGIVAAVALPAYQDYAKRQAVSVQQTESVSTPPAAVAVDWDKGAITPLVKQPPLPSQANYESGTAAKRRNDYSSALDIYHQLAIQGDARAQDALGVMHENGQGTPQNYQEAAKWYRLAAQQGYANAQSNLGAIYHFGNGSARNYAEAVKWYRLAASQGHTNAQVNLGVLYGEGQGVPLDTIRATMWFSIAATSGNQTALQNRDMAEKTFDSQTFNWIQKMAMECLRLQYQGCD